MSMLPLRETRVWRWLTAPSAAIEEVEDRRRAQLLASLLILIIPIAAIVMVIRAITDADFQPSVVAVVGIAVMTVVYGVSRTRHFRWSVAVSAGIFPAGIFTIVAAGYDPSALPSLLSYLSLGVVLSGILLPAGGIALLAVVDAAGILFLPVLVPQLTFTAVISPLTFLVLLAGLVLISKRHRSLVEHDRQGMFHEQTERLRQIMNTVPVGLALMDSDGKIVDTNPVADGYLAELGQIDGPRLPESDAPTSTLFSPAAEENTWREATGNQKIFEVLNSPLHQIAHKMQLVVVIRDVTREREMQQELQQQDRMAAIGQLAGGIAHDFNNILVPIIGYVDLALRELPQESAIRDDLMRVNEAAERAAALTRQILAFSRKQVLEMKPLNLNVVVTEFEVMLRRLIEEDIRLQTNLEPSAGTVRGDRGQIEQILMNLAVNARDAMPDGGALIIETSNVVLDDAYAARHAEVTAGDFVMLTFSDTGLGMDDNTRRHIFEPFFTTKERGRGTGLGLATVFGIVKQHSGHISLYSEPGQGTTFRIYLPLSVAAPTDPTETGDGGTSRQGSETIMVVEDEKLVRRLVCDTLSANGYRVIEADGPTTGSELARECPDTIHLLLTDVVMPGMNGGELFRVLRESRPDLKVLYMSGYTDNVIAHHGILDEGVNLLQKPFSVQDLTNKVRVALE